MPDTPASYGYEVKQRYGDGQVTWTSGDVDVSMVRAGGREGWNVTLREPFSDSRHVKTNVSRGEAKRAVHELMKKHRSSRAKTPTFGGDEDFFF